MRRVLLARVFCSVGLFVAFSVFAVCPWACNAQEYQQVPTEVINNSGANVFTEVWCTQGHYVLVFPIDTDVKCLAFDGSSGYQLINNTSSTITGYAYHLPVGGGNNYQFRMQSFGNLQFYLPSGQYYHWVDQSVTWIYATSMDLQDNYNNRGNDYYKGVPVDRRWDIIVIIVGGLVILVSGFCIFRLRRRWH